jgi:hypothetical protein
MRALRIGDYGLAIATTVVLAAVACGGSGGGGNTARDSLTERQKDSILAKSKIPGASAVDRAMRAADSMSVRVQAADTIGN